MGKGTDIGTSTPPVEDAPPRYFSSSEFSDDDGVILPKGALDPVYEAKARVLNHAVSEQRK